MYRHLTRGRFTTQNTDLVFPISPQFESELIALARRCITLCVRFPFVLCFLRVPMCIRPFSSPVSRLFAFPRLTSAPRAHVHPYCTLNLCSLALPLSSHANSW